MAEIIHVSNEKIMFLEKALDAVRRGAATGVIVAVTSDKGGVGFGASLDDTTSPKAMKLLNEVTKAVYEYLGERGSGSEAHG